jgi:hypothetical protein
MFVIIYLLNDLFFSDRLQRASAGTPASILHRLYYICFISYMFVIIYLLYDLFFSDRLQRRRLLVYSARQGCPGTCGALRSLSLSFLSLSLSLTCVYIYTTSSRCVLVCTCVCTLRPCVRARARTHARIRARAQTHISHNIQQTHNTALMLACENKHDAAAG